METLSQSSKLSRIVGQSFFPLFIDKRNEMPVTVELKNKDNMVAHTGFYQMPIYHVKATETTPFTYEKFIYHNRIPGASFLLRCFKNPKSENENEYVTPAPEFKDGVYSTKYFIADDIEKMAMQIRRKRPNPSLMSIMKHLMNELGVDGNQEEEAVYKYFFDNIKCDKKSELIDLNFHSQYEPKIGIRFNVECIHNTKTQNFFGTMASVIPEATYYNPDR